ncbi:DUF4326 domain-containing protein [Microvirga antarctica]|uniref:DUF4326 domain-containing protein n=1 Tax=Microvirga antarctica TaxID=2819233 RepID=UPI001B309B9D|nr:DUF4326 domain-containing protein [Microvirga antarctica]
MNRPHRFQTGCGNPSPENAVCVGPGTAWSNPFADARPLQEAFLKRASLGRFYYPNNADNRHWAAVELYRKWCLRTLDALAPCVASHIPRDLPPPPDFATVQAQLAGKLLASPCPATERSHADILALIANATNGLLLLTFRYPPPHQIIRNRRAAARQAERGLRAFRANRWAGL